MTLFGNQPEINWFTAANFCKQALSTYLLLLRSYAKNFSAARNINDDVAPANLVNISRM